MLSSAELPEVLRRPEVSYRRANPNLLGRDVAEELCLSALPHNRQLLTHLDASGRCVADGNIEEDNRAGDARRRIERGRHDRRRKSNVDKGACFSS